MKVFWLFASSQKAFLATFMEFLHGVRIVIVRSDENLLGFLKDLQLKILNESKSEGVFNSTNFDGLNRPQGIYRPPTDERSHPK
jgi:hypothetical protein